MIELDADIVVMGAGFSGSLLALLLKQIGLKPVLIDRGSTRVLRSASPRHRWPI